MWSKVYVFLLLFTVVLDFYIARFISLTEDPKKRKILLWSSIVVNLGILGFFKYYNFFVHSLDGALGLVGIEDQVFPHLDLILPIGISFYTFQSMSYVIDVYRRTSDSHAHLLAFAGYVTLFPHQISGPLVRHNNIVPQLEANSTYVFHSENFWRGCFFFVIGLSKKILIADRIALVVDPLVNGMAQASNAEAILAMFGYTTQLYFDFSGYSDMAVGLGMMMNIQFPQNFNSPYKSISITEFWQRWHITLSAWLRDYLYISLGGNRLGKLKTYRNLMLTMAIGGLWHGANWTFVIWGVLHGTVLAAERFFKDRGWDILKYRLVKWAGTFSLVNVAWIFFRAASVNDAILWIKKVFLMAGDKTGELTWDVMHIALRDKDRFFICLGVGLLIAVFAKNTFEIKFRPSVARAFILAFLFVLCLSFMGEESPFLYFQF
ncbi:Peptidoglycan O-acetyltransferase [compost metagenome]